MDEKKDLVSIDSLIDSLDSVTWYNGLAEYILEWKKGKHLEILHGTSIHWSYDDQQKLDSASFNQLQVIWMICVNLFGEYGTSPRSGWIEIENIEAFHDFLDRITETYRE